MRQRRWFLMAFLVAIALLASWLWWAKPRQVDMAAYAPANSLLYLEANQPVEVARVLAATDAGKILESFAGKHQAATGNIWLQRFVRWTGIGPIESVILARSQIAVVVTDLGATEDADTLRVKPEGALIIETQTAESRIRPPVEKAIKKLAELTYGKPVFRGATVDGVDLFEWTAPRGGRQIVGAIVGSRVIVGNTQQAVQSCLAVIQGRRPNLAEDPELKRLRLQLRGEEAVSFGYVPAANGARLLSIGVPILLGRAPANSEFQRLITTGAGKVFGSLAWSSRPFMSGIEDRFLISLQPSIVTRLKQNFTSTKISSEMQQILPNDVHSVTYYKFENPLSAWQDVKGAVSSQIDALSAIVFSSLLKSALSSYGIEEPEAFLAAVNAGIFTLRMDQDSERSMLIARVRDQEKLRELFSRTMRVRTSNDGQGQPEMLQDPQSEFAAGFIGEFVVMGSPDDVRRYTEAVRNRTVLSDPDKLRKITFFVPLHSDASIVTYANDSDRARRFISAAIAARSGTPVGGNRMDQLLRDLPYSATETSLGEHGLERTTRSPLGQFSTLLPLLIPEQHTP